MHHANLKKKMVGGGGSESTDFYYANFSSGKILKQ